jgi:hypothetical protein
MAYFGDVQDATVKGKLGLFMTAVAELICDNDEAIDGHGRTPDELEFRDGFEFTAPAYLNFYWSTGTGTPFQDKLIERLIDSQAEEWARQFPNRAPMLDILSGDDDGEFRSEAEEWEQAALQDEAIYIRVEAFRDHGDIKFRSCFTNEINAPLEEELEIVMAESEFLALDSDGLESLGNRIAEAPYLNVIAVQSSGGLWHSWFGTSDGKTAYFPQGGCETEEAARRAVSRAMQFT